MKQNPSEEALRQEGRCAICRALLWGALSIIVIFDLIFLFTVHCAEIEGVVTCDWGISWVGLR